MDDYRLPSQLAGPSEKRIGLRVTPSAERQIRSGHPWLFDQAIQHQSHAGQSGDLAVIFDRKRRFLAIGLYDPTSPLRVRVLQMGKPITIDEDWFYQRLASAAKIRLPLLREETTGFRLVHGENDGMPGLVLDRYGRSLVLKLYTAAWLPHLPAIVSAVKRVTVPTMGEVRRIVLRLSRQVADQDDLLFGLEDGMVIQGKGVKKPVKFLENGLVFEADIVQGQKTGFFLDQRDNRARVETLSMGKQVLNLFAFSGGFSLYAARGGASTVISTDLSQHALASAMCHFKLNGEIPAVAACKHEILLGDAFRVMQQLRENGQRFDMVIVDPPAFAKRQDEVEGALHAYGRLTRLALDLLRPGGMLVSSSCSSRVSAEAFYDTVLKAAQSKSRPLREIARTGHGLDHPIGYPEGAYLKTLFAIAD